MDVIGRTANFDRLPLLRPQRAADVFVGSITNDVLDSQPLVFRRKDDVVCQFG